jgi:hypothetical protein
MVASLFRDDVRATAQNTYARSMPPRSALSMIGLKSLAARRLAANIATSLRSRDVAESKRVRPLIVESDVNKQQRTGVPK